MKKIFFIILLASLNTNTHAKTMKDVMANCDLGQQFDSYSYCIKETYTKEGDYPNHPSIRSFFAKLEVLVEQYDQKKISNAYAKSLAYDSYGNIVQHMDEDWTEGLNRFARELRQRGFAK